MASSKKNSYLDLMRERVNVIIPHQQATPSKIIENSRSVLITCIPPTQTFTKLLFLLPLIFKLRSFMQQCLMGGWWCSQWTWPHAIPIDSIHTSVTLIYFPLIFVMGGAKKSDLSLYWKLFLYSCLISIHNFYICCQRTNLWLQSLLIPNRKSKLYF